MNSTTINWRHRTEWWEDESGRYVVFPANDQHDTYAPFYFRQPNANGVPLGEYPTLPQARAAAEEHARRRGVGRPPVGKRC